MTVFEGQVFLAHNLGLMKYDGSELVPITVDIGRSLSCHRMHGTDGVLWSFGEKDCSATTVFPGPKSSARKTRDTFWNPQACHDCAASGRAARRRSRLPSG